MKTVFFIICLFSAATVHSQPVEIVVADSVYRSGIVQGMADNFNFITGKHVPFQIRAGDSAQILSLAEKKQIHLVITHHAVADFLLRKRYGWKQNHLLQDEFLFLGPKADPFNIKQQKDLNSVLHLLQDKKVIFHVPGLSSGIPQRLNQLWAVAQIVPNWDAYQNSSSSAHASLLKADLLRGYTFTDLSSYLRYREDLKNIVPLYRDDPALINDYSIVLLRHAENFTPARSFFDYALSENGQAFINGYKKGNKRIFMPSAHLDEELQTQYSVRNNKFLLLLTAVLSLVIIVLIQMLRNQKHLRRMEYRQRLNENRFMSAVENTNDGFWDYEMDDHHYYYSNKFIQLLSLGQDSNGDLLEILAIKVHPIDRSHVLHTLKRWMDSTNQEKCIVEFRTGKNHDHWFQLRGSVTRDESGQVIRFSGSLTDITEIKQMDEMIHDLEYQAYHDSLTGLPNRALFFDRIKQTYKTAQRENFHFSLIMIDVNKFKFINDNLGHGVGDEVLKTTAERLQHSIRQSDTVVRLGGDEFCILLPKSSSDSISDLLEKILANFEKDLVLLNNKFKISISLGVASYPDDASSIADLLERADQAMYVAKRNASGYVLYKDIKDISHAEAS